MNPIGASTIFDRVRIAESKIPALAFPEHDARPIEPKIDLVIGQNGNM